MSVTFKWSLIFQAEGTLSSFLLRILKYLLRMLVSRNIAPTSAANRRQKTWWTRWTRLSTLAMISTSLHAVDILQKLPYLMTSHTYQGYLLWLMSWISRWSVKNSYACLEQLTFQLVAASMCLYVSLCTHRFFPPSICPFVCPSEQPVGSFHCPSICPPVHLSIRLAVWPTVFLFVCLSVSSIHWFKVCFPEIIFKI